MKQTIAATGIATIALCGCAASVPRSATTPDATTASPARPGSADGEAVRFAPVLATVPAFSGPTGHPAPTSHPASAGPPAAPTAAASSGQPGGGGSPSPAGGGSPAVATCASPSFSTTAQQGGETIGSYYVGNDMWNVSDYSVAQTLYACSPSSWYVTATMNNNTGDNAVKTYPNAHMDFVQDPMISGFHSVASSFAQADFPGGIYEYAYDIWINGIASSGATEIMIWTYNHGQRPAGSQVATTTIGGQAFQVWKNGDYIAFVAEQNVTSGTVNLLQFFDYAIGQGWMTSSATLDQVDYGIELVSTDAVPETFAVTRFSVASS